MKTFKYNKKNSKWYKKIDWIKIAFVSIILFLVLFVVLNSLQLGKDIILVLRTCLIIVFLIDFELCLNDVLENKKRIFLIDNDKISYVEIHDGKDGKLLSDREYDEMIKNVKVESIFSKQKDFEGIDCGEIVEVLNLKKRMNGIKIKVKVKSKEWKPIGVLAISRLELVEKEYIKKMVISKDYSNFDELLLNLNKKIN